MIYTHARPPSFTFVQAPASLPTPPLSMRAPFPESALCTPTSQLCPDAGLWDDFLPPQPAVRYGRPSMGPRTLELSTRRRYWPACMPAEWFLKRRHLRRDPKRSDKWSALRMLEKAGDWYWAFGLPNNGP
ncbi:hypothetical protein FA95DRAFT_1684794 [Auriscalpium vulgare]|uniref:Uncharacterized protein n=1 Tax=Auriscalpium vulgare TaxID=40419 RepID=A0ACB8R172_9AGAM|nr:hypothetical protein FA95DRAFT_1684794 [Auriscalpium vulgare]